MQSFIICSCDNKIKTLFPLPFHPLRYFSFQPVLHDLCNKGRGMCYSVCGMVHIKEPLLLIGKSSLCGSSGFPLSLSEWSLTICLMPYNRKQDVLSASLNKTFPSFLPFPFQSLIATCQYQMFVCVISVMFEL